MTCCFGDRESFRAPGGGPPNREHKDPILETLGRGSTMQATNEEVPEL